MGNREEALRKIFDAAGVGARLTDDQKRELLAHLEDSVEKKVGAGVAEIDAVGQAFSELGDLRKIARQFPDRPAAVTPEGVPVLSGGISYAWMAFSFLAFFIVMGGFVVPRFAEIYNQVRVPLPGLTIFFINLSHALGSKAGLAGMALLMGGLVLVRLLRIRIPQPISLGVLLGSAILCLGLLTSLFVPLLSLLEGIGRR